MTTTTSAPSAMLTCMNWHCLQDRAVGSYLLCKLIAPSAKLETKAVLRKGDRGDKASAKLKGPAI